MISLLRGKIADKSEGSLIVDVGGVGYGVTVPLSTYSNLTDTGTDVELKIHTHIKENALELFGFLTDNEKNIFQCLIGISGIGPKGATNILSNITPEDLINSIISGDLPRRKVPGIGPKTATRIINELKDKLPTFDSDKSPVAASSVANDLKSVLLNLGFTRNEIDENKKQLNDITEKTGNIEESVREALKVMKKI
ncbi:MAG: Holliday junction branch migration protein RuvA [Thermodesulfobacteriota bacterium]